ncbi:hypothetical protein E8E12_003512 [Didymella heteroderae]|uniref:Uncharacterized protein n=1 Tax=Didymella heteroderae TaxID=1769908 RepID=A0A9P4WIZ6_9PLEO|nr:hypothetical protein E8E12_003512 [Didymella heteroderae]
MASSSSFISTDIKGATTSPQNCLDLQALNNVNEGIASPSAVSAVPIRDTASLSFASYSASDPNTIIDGPSSFMVADQQLYHHHGTAPCDGDTVWFCDNCGNGPMGTWYSACTDCGHYRCGGCIVEETS